MSAACGAVRCALLYAPKQVCQSNPCLSVGTACYPYAFGSATNTTSSTDCLQWCCQVDSAKLALVVGLPVGLVCLIVAFIVCYAWRRGGEKNQRRSRQESLRLINRDSVIIVPLLGPSPIPAAIGQQPPTADRDVVSDGIVLSYDHTVMITPHNMFPHAVRRPADGYTT